MQDSVEYYTNVCECFARDLLKVLKTDVVSSMRMSAEATQRHLVAIKTHKRKIKRVKTKIRDLRNLLHI